jgi:NAD(P)-dependent dehydrogenase (short-subunit alcohol dehydrogenase family)
VRLDGKVALVTGATRKHAIAEMARAGGGSIVNVSSGVATKDIAWGCVYLASDESRYVTGTVLPIDGGYLACPS